MTIEDIRKKHEELRDLIKPDQRDYIQPCIAIADVDRLFAALDSLQKEYDQYKELVGESLMKEVKRLDRELDEARDGLTAAHMHGFEEGRDQYRDKVKKLQDALDEARGKVGQIITALNGEHLTREAIHKIEQILGGGE